MKNAPLRKSISILLVIVMFCSVFAIPVGNNNQVNASTTKVSAPGDKITVSLRYDSHGQIHSKITVIEGGVYPSLPTLSKTGYDFLGWFTKENVQVKSGDAVNPATKHLYGGWKGKQYTVKFNANKGKVSKKSKKVTFGSKYGKLPKPKRKGYTFLGWFHTKKGGFMALDHITVNTAKNHTLYAIWQKPTTVTFNANGGKLKKKSKKVTPSKSYGKLPTPKKSGYCFSGWYTKKKGGKLITKTSKVETSSKFTLYAHWSKPMTIKFDAQGGVLSKTSKKVGKKGIYGKLPKPTKTINTENGPKAYYFVGWYTEPNGRGKYVKAESRIVYSKPHTLYARWSNVAY